MEIQKETQAKIQALNASNDEYLLAEEDKIRDIFEAKSDAIREATRRKVTLRREENSQEMSERCQEKEAAIQREAEDSKDKARKEMEKEVRSQVQKLEEKQVSNEHSFPTFDSEILLHPHPPWHSLATTLLTRCPS